MDRGIIVPDKNHVTRRSYAEIQEIMQPLKELFGVNSLTYQRIYYNGTYLTLTSHEEWSEYYWTHDCYKVVDGLPAVGFRKILIDPYVAPESLYYEKVVKPARTLFDLYHVVVFLRHQILYTDIFIFTFPEDNELYEAMANDYISIISQFIFHFKEKTRKLIIEHKKNPILWAIKPGKKIKYSIDKKFIPNEKILKMLSRISSSRYYLGDNYGNIYLTSREMDYLKLIFMELKNKTIAKKLNISTRTVEKYIGILKSKLNCSSKQQLVSISKKIMSEYDLNIQRNKTFIHDKLKNNPEIREKINKILGCDPDDISFYS